MKRKASPKPAPQAASPFEFSGGALCLDFANTVNQRLTTKRHDLLPDLAALAAWSREAGLFSEARAREMQRHAARSPARAQADLRRAKALREAIYETCLTIAAGRAPEARHLNALNELLTNILASSKLAAHGRQFLWTHSGDANALDAALWAVARSAADLLTSDALAQLRECQADTCAWLFLDRSKNGSRRWCDMKVCGNRAKVQRFRRRTRTQRSGS